MSFFFKGIHSTRALKGLITPSLRIFNAQATSALQLSLFTKERNQARHVIIVITKFQQPLSKATERAEPLRDPFFLMYVSLPPPKSMASMAYCQSGKCDVIAP